MGWFLKLISSGYEDYRQDVEEAAYSNPRAFDEWFPEGDRVYIPLSAPQPDEDEVDLVIANELNSNGFEITDYLGGYCSKGNRTYRIGRTLESIRRGKLKQIDQQQVTEQALDVGPQKQEVNDYYNDLLHVFNNSQHRIVKNQDNLVVVISQDPHDIAAMSTDRGWSSCTNLEGGAHRDSAFCEVRQGGLIAYLVHPQDKNIENPVGRLLIRRFENRFKENVALPEDVVYGTDAPGFKDTVKAWLDQKQGDLRPGAYDRRGGDQSDTFDNEHFVKPVKQEDMIAWLRGEAPDAKYIVWRVNDDLADRVNDVYGDGQIISDKSATFMTEEEARIYVDENKSGHDTYDAIEFLREQLSEVYEDEEAVEEELGQPRFSVSKKDIDNQYKMKEYAAWDVSKSNEGTYPPEVLEEAKQHAITKSVRGNTSMLMTFIRHHRDAMTVEDVSKVRIRNRLNVISELPENIKDHFRGEYVNLAMLAASDLSSAVDMDVIRSQLSAFSVESDINIKMNRASNAMQTIWNTMMNDILAPIEMMHDKIPDNVANQIATIPDQIRGIMPEKAIELLKNHLSIDEMALTIVQSLTRGNSAAEGVQGLIDSLLPKYGERFRHFYPNDFSDMEGSPINVETLGTYIGYLGPAGQKYLPFLKEMSQNKQDEYVKAVEGSESEMASNNSYVSRQINNYLEAINKDINSYDRIIDKIEGGHRQAKASNWFKRAMRKVANYGEWWIDDLGGTTYADGDNGDYNHEAVVIERCQQELKEAIEFDDILNSASYLFGESGDYGGYDPIAVRTGLHDWADSAINEGLLTEDEGGDIYEYIIQKTELPENVVDAAMGNLDDARVLAMQEWGWKRFAGRNIETWTLTQKDLSIISTGLESILTEYENDNPDFNIYVFSTNMWYNDIPMSAIESGDIRKATGQDVEEETTQVIDNSQEAYDNAFREQVDKPSIPFYSNFSD